MDKIKILIVGAGGYGHIYVDCLLDDCADYSFEIVGAVDPVRSGHSYERLTSAGVKFYDSMDEFYAGNEADLCIISSPIHFHKTQVLCALKNGSNVLCEKPTAGCLEDIDEMIKARDEAGKFVAIGYQLSYADSILALKKDIQSGVWGKPKLLKSITFMPRPYTYFGARSWSGKRYSADGTAIMDSVANNAAAHTLHNMFFVLGDKFNTCDIPVSSDIRLYRANKVETFDAIAAKFKTKGGVDVLYCAAHPIEHVKGPAFDFIFENGTISFDIADKDIIGKFNDGTVKNYGPAGDHRIKIYKVLESMLSGKDEISCTLESTLGHAKAISMVTENLDKVKTFKPDEICEVMMKPDNPGNCVKGLEEKLIKAYETNILPD